MLSHARKRHEMGFSGLEDLDDMLEKSNALFFDVGENVAKMRMPDHSFKKAESYRGGAKGFVEAVWEAVPPIILQLELPNACCEDGELQILKTDAWYQDFGFPRLVPGPPQAPGEPRGLKRTLSAMRDEQFPDQGLHAEATADSGIQMIGPGDVVLSLIHI